MSARDEFPAPRYGSGVDDILLTDWRAMCDRIDTLTAEHAAMQRVIRAACAWRRTRYAMHINTSDGTQRHADAVRGAEQNLRLNIETLLEGFDGSWKTEQ